VAGELTGGDAEERAGGQGADLHRDPALGAALTDQHRPLVQTGDEPLAAVGHPVPGTGSGSTGASRLMMKVSDRDGRPRCTPGGRPLVS
jgi:hypothetical protein